MPLNIRAVIYTFLLSLGIPLPLEGEDSEKVEAAICEIEQYVEWYFQQS